MTEHLIEQTCEAIKAEAWRLYKQQIAIDLADIRPFLKALVEAVSATASELPSHGEFACEVCGNTPDAEGNLEHGKGCYKLSEDGGGWEYVEEADQRPIQQSANAPQVNRDVHDLRIVEVVGASAPQAAAGERRTAWLIEGGGVYWHGRGSADWRQGHEDAVRFARQEDAELVLHWMLPEEYRRTCRATEHVWIDSAASPPSPAPAAARNGIPDNIMVEHTKQAIMRRWNAGQCHPNYVDIISDSCGWLPLNPSESMTVHYGDAEYVIQRRPSAPAAAQAREES